MKIFIVKIIFYFFVSVPCGADGKDQCQKLQYDSIEYATNRQTAKLLSKDPPTRLVVEGKSSNVFQVHIDSLNYITENK